MIMCVYSIIFIYTHKHNYIDLYTERNAASSGT